MVYPTGTWFCANRCWFVHQINQHYCSLPPSWKGLRQGWHSLACIERWRPRVPWTPPETYLYLSWNVDWIVCSLRTAYCSSKSSANPAICVKFLRQTKVNQLHSIVLPVVAILNVSTFYVVWQPSRILAMAHHDVLWLQVKVNDLQRKKINKMTPIYKEYSMLPLAHDVTMPY